MYEIKLDDRVAKMQSATCLLKECKKGVAMSILQTNHHDGFICVFALRTRHRL